MSDTAISSTTDVSAEVTRWIDEHWRLDMPLAVWWRLLSDAGYAFPHWPAAYRGGGLGPAQSQAILTVLGRAGVIGPPTGIAPTMGVPTVLTHGTDDQQARFVRPVANGQETWCQLFSEPGAGSDLASLACKAERHGDEYVVTGQKVWNSGADISEWGMLLARTNPDVPKHSGISWMMIDMRQEGVEVRPLVQMNGDAKFCEVFITEARVPIDNVIGGIDNGWAVARTTLSYERGSIGRRRPRGLIEVRAGRLGGNLDRSVGELIQRANSAAGDPTERSEVMLGAKSMIRLLQPRGLAGDPVVRNRVADYFIRSEVHRLNGMRAHDNAKGGRPGPEGSVGKLSTAMLAHRSRDLSMSMLGAEGMLIGDDARSGGAFGGPDSGKVQRACLSSFAPSLGGGTNEIQRNIIGERSLGLPREPGDDAEIPFRELKRS